MPLSSQRRNPLCHAAEMGDVEALRLLLDQPHVLDPWDLRDAAALAAVNDQVDCLRLLLPLLNPLKCQCELLRQAACSNSRRCLEVLLPMSDVAAAWEGLVDAGQWAGVETLADHVDADRWAWALDQAPVGALPHLQARWEQFQLSVTLDPAARPLGSATPRRRM